MLCSSVKRRFVQFEFGSHHDGRYFDITGRLNTRLLAFVTAVGALVSPAAAQSFISYDDYPPASLRAGEQGTVGFRLTISKTGRAKKCTVIQSSGYPRLDDATCKILLKRARFKPARDAFGKAREDQFESQMQWRIS